MMARSVRRNGTTLSGRWKLGGEANMRKKKKNGKAEVRRLDKVDKSRGGRQKCEEIASRVRKERGSMLEL
jgi:hypothetical protein